MQSILAIDLDRGVLSASGKDQLGLPGESTVSGKGIVKIVAAIVVESMEVTVRIEVSG